MLEQPRDGVMKAIGDETEEQETVTAPEGRLIMVVIAIDEYQHHMQLGNAVNDAKSIVELFKECGFEELPDARSLFNAEATREAIITLVSEQLPTELTPDDSLVLFFAGHGEMQHRRGGLR